MELQINEKFRVKGDDNQWILYARTTDKNGKLTARETVVGFYPSLEGLCNALVQRQVRTCNATTLNDALEAVANIIEDVTAAFSPEFIITIKSKRNRK
jgi:hypothetical protein